MKACGLSGALVSSFSFFPAVVREAGRSAAYSQPWYSVLPNHRDNEM